MAQLKNWPAGWSFAILSYWVFVVVQVNLLFFLFVNPSRLLVEHLDRWHHSSLQRLDQLNDLSLVPRLITQRQKALSKILQRLPNLPLRIPLLINNLLLKPLIHKLFLLHLLKLLLVQFIHGLDLIIKLDNPRIQFEDLVACDLYFMCGFSQLSLLSLIALE